MSRWSLGWVALVLFSHVSFGQETAQMFPFVLPWDDVSPGVTNLAAWGHSPAGKLGFVHSAPDGHFYAGDQRIRFFGVNLCFGANVPRKEDADKVAARLARFGVNVVRFHHMDSSTYPNGIRPRTAAKTSELDPEALDRLDYLISRLKHHGVYANLNLLVGRNFNQADGLPADIDQADKTERHIIALFHKSALQPQMDYARNLLAHRNPYTKMTYCEDPAVAFVEISNENGLLHGWLGGHVDRMPEVFLAELQRQWNAWLAKRYPTTAALRKAWGVKEEPLGNELLANNHFTQGMEKWNLERHGVAAASATPSNDLPKAPLEKADLGKSLHIKVTKPGEAGWHVQCSQSGLKIEPEKPYTLTFWAKGNFKKSLIAAVGQAHEPWQNLGLHAEFKPGPEWQQFRFVFLPSAADENARVSFSNLALQTGELWLAGVSFRPGGVAGLGPKERLEDASVPVFLHGRAGERTIESQRDWLRFLWDTEDNYWQTMQRYLKEELKVKAVVMGTIVGCSTPNLQARLDTVDTHSYWQHPHFPGRPWDPENWIVHNRTMVNEVGGTLPGLALRRVLGKPHNCTEYNHPAPNTYGSEGFLLLAAYAGLQDWDAIYAFAYSHRQDWDLRRIPHFFDIDQHPTRMVTLPAAVALFVRGDVKPAREQITVAMDKEREVDALRTSWAWELVHGGHVGIPKEATLIHRIALVTENTKKSAAPGGKVKITQGPKYPSDTGELLWDLSDKKHGVVTINSAKSKAVIGFGGGKRFDLGGVIVEPGKTLQDGWAALTLTVMEGELQKGPARLLISATGSAENTDMKWKSPAKDSVGRDWGKSPSLVEGIPARLTLPRPATTVKVWALDERGQRGNPIPVRELGGNNTTFEIGPQWRTLWYEVLLSPQ